ncbi:MAG: rhomboid family intramembrane serine protease [Thiogranum sp.]|nr:rhomboid family intramembrane serine protease [Thiogranum sp.]
MHRLEIGLTTVIIGALEVKEEIQVRMPRILSGSLRCYAVFAMALPEQHEDSRRLRLSFLLTAAFVAFLWFLKAVELLGGLDFSQYGVYPRRVEGLVGIALAPLIHGSVSHLFANTLPLLILGTALLYGYPRSARRVIPVLYLGSGLAVWLFARSAWHIGASGLTFGMTFFIFVIGALRWDRRAIALAMIVFFFYGSMIWGLFPTAPSISFESHLAGAVFGVVLAFLLRDQDPKPPEKHYTWENDGDGDEPLLPEDR